MTLEAARTSPDGKWLLWTRYTHGLHDFTATEIGTGRQVSSNSILGTDWDPIWLADGTTWAAITLDADGVHEKCTCVDRSTGQIFAAIALPGGRDEWFLAGPGAGRTVIAIRYADINGRAEQATLLVIDPSASISVHELLTPDFGSNATYKCMALSRSGKRAAWLCTRTPDTGHPSWLRRLYALMGRNDRPHAELWVGSWDGTVARYVGSVPSDAVELDGSNPLAWTPDERRVSLVMNGKLFTIPAD
jgi:hypothetical protein